MIIPTLYDMEINNFPRTHLDQTIITQEIPQGTDRMPVATDPLTHKTKSPAPRSLTDTDHSAVRP
jgi:hypothetical protein